MEKNLKILHVIDDKKFIPYCNATFESDTIENTFTRSEDFEVIANTNYFHIIAIHYLNTTSAHVLNKNDFDAPVIWFFWGGDGFLLGKFSNSFLLPKTKTLLLKQAFSEGLGLGIKTFFKSLIPTLADKLQNNSEVICSLDKINIVVPVMPGDYHLMNQKYGLKAPMFHLNYVNPIFDESQITLNIGDNILLGNSASYSNNHLESIDLLSEMDLGNRHVIIPLSYGDKKYGEYINSYAKKKLEDKVICLMEFVPLEDYFKLLESCPIVIMNHLRQQAVGNIVPMLAKGSHVYLQLKSSLYQFLKENGFVVSSIDEVKSIRELTNEEKIKNAKLCVTFFGKKTQHRKVETLLKTVLTDR